MEGQNPQAPAEPPKKIVWIKCRASEGCEGNQAEIVFVHNASPVSGDGSFIPEAGGRSVRYKCTTCGNPFHVRS